jgi:serine/threonine kinase PknH
MTVFISHSSRDHAAVRSLVQHLQSARETVWLDQSLVGGEAWWDRILHQIRSCTVFLIALSNNCLQSKPCRAEIDYAKALGLPILPVLIGEVDSYRIDPIFTVQSIDYRNPDVNSGMALLAALHERATERNDLPDPLPDPPPVPYEYLQRLGVAIDSPEELSPTEQSTILSDLRRALREEDDETVRNDIQRLLQALRRRSEVTHGTVAEIDDILRTYPAAWGDTAVPAPEPDTATTAKSRAQEAASSDNLVGQPPPSDPMTQPTQPPGRISPKAIAIAVVAVVVVVVLAVVGYLMFGRTSQGSAVGGGSTTTASPPAPVAVADLPGLLLTAAEIDTALGTTGMAFLTGFDAQKETDQGSSLDNKDCTTIVGTIEKSELTGSGYAGVYAQAFSDNPDLAKNKYQVNEAVVAFPSAVLAAKFFAASTQRWPACSNLVYHFQSPTGPGNWSVGPVSNSSGTLSAVTTNEGSGGWAFERALTVVNNVAVEVSSASYNPDDSAVKIAHQIAAKVARQ